MGLRRHMVKELDLKLTLGMAERTESLHLMRNHGEEGVSGSNLCQTQSYPLSESGCFLSSWSQNRLGIARTVNEDQKKRNGYFVCPFYLAAG